MVHKVDADGATEDNAFTDGNGMDIQPTQLGAKWHNMVQGEMVALCQAAGIALDDEDNAQLVAVMSILIANSPHATPLGGWQMSSRVIADDDYYKFPKGQALALPAYQTMLDALDGDPFLTTIEATKIANPSLWWHDADNDLLYMPDERGQFSRIWHDDLAPDGVARPALGRRKANQNLAHVHDVPEGAEPPGSGDLASGDDYTSIVHATVPTGSSGGDEAVPDHTAHYYRIRVK